MAVIYRGTSLTTALVPRPGKTRRITVDTDTVTRVFTCATASADSMLPALGSTTSGYPDHQVKDAFYQIDEGEQAIVTVIYEKPTDSFASITLPTTTPPPVEYEYQFGMMERHLAAHSSASTTQWLGYPKTNGFDDPFGQPTTTTAGIKPFQHYLVPTLVYRQISYTTATPSSTSTSGAAVGHLQRPPGETTSTSKWLKTGMTGRKRKDQYWWTVSDEWTFDCIGEWDDEVYTAAT